MGPPARLVRPGTDSLHDGSVRHHNRGRYRFGRVTGCTVQHSHRPGSVAPGRTRERPRRGVQYLLHAHPIPLPCGCMGGYGPPHPSPIMGLLRGVRFLVPNDTNSRKRSQNRLGTGGIRAVGPAPTLRRWTRQRKKEERWPVPPPLLTRSARSLSPPPTDNYL